MLNTLESFQNKRVLMLQGPMGPFFARFATAIQEVAESVHKVNFNGGDWLFFCKKAINFYGKKEEWSFFLAELIDNLNIDIILLFGDCRQYHEIARKVAVEKHIDVGVFEEGYVRPDFITLEHGGVNAYSTLPKDPNFFLDKPIVKLPKICSVGKSFKYTMLWAIFYALATVLMSPIFKYYRHHRSLNLLNGAKWCRSFLRKALYRFKEKSIAVKLQNVYSKKYFLIPLQIHTDAQVQVHSHFNSIVEFIDEVMFSFAKHAPAETVLVIKHHPLDRGYYNYSQYIASNATKLGIHGRVFYVHDLHLPILLANARGVVVINSTVGLSALAHACPTKVCGSAIYDLPGLTFQGNLADFWKAAEKLSIDQKLYLHFHNYLVHFTQLNGNFYCKLKQNEKKLSFVWSAINTQYINNIGFVSEKTPSFTSLTNAQ